TIALNDIQQKEDIPQAEKAKITLPETTDSSTLSVIAQADSPPEIAQNTVAANKTKSYTPEPDIVVEPLATVLEEKDSSTDLEEVRVIGYAPLKKQDIAGAVSSISSENLMAARMGRADK